MFRPVFAFLMNSEPTLDRVMDAPNQEEQAEVTRAAYLFAIGGPVVGALLYFLLAKPLMASFYGPMMAIMEMGYATSGFRPVSFLVGEVVSDLAGTYVCLTFGVPIARFVFAQLKHPFPSEWEQMFSRLLPWFLAAGNLILIVPRSLTPVALFMPFFAIFIWVWTLFAAYRGWHWMRYSLAKMKQNTNYTDRSALVLGTFVVAYAGVQIVVNMIISRVV